MPSVPVGLVDDIDPGGAFEQICLRQRFAAGGELIACEGAAAGDSLLVQGVPAPGQTVTLELGVVYAGEAEPAWSGQASALPLGEVPAVPLDFRVYGEAPSTPDYPPLLLAAVEADELRVLYAMALLNAPDFGIAAGDILWSLDISSEFEDNAVELHSLASGLITWTLENDEDEENRPHYDPDFAGVVTVAADRAGYERHRTDAFGYLHHGNAAFPGGDALVVNGYELLTDGGGDPLELSLSGQTWPLVGATFKAAVVDPAGGFSRGFELSYHALLGQDPDAITALPPIVLTGPGGERYVPMYYVNATELSADADDPERFHLAGTLLTPPFTGAFHLALDRDGAVEVATHYSPSNEALSWPAGFEGFGDPHSAERYPGEPGAEHLLIYDQSVRGGSLEGCSGFYHLRDEGGVIALGGPYQAVFELEGFGPACGSSQAFGDASVAGGVRLEGYEQPVELVFVSDNVAVEPSTAGSDGALEEVYYEGSPRVTAAWLSADPLDPDGWSLAYGFAGTNPADVSPPGFNTVTTWAPALTVGDAPFKAPWEE